MYHPPWKKVERSYLLGSVEVLDLRIRLGRSSYLSSDNLLQVLLLVLQELLSRETGGAEAVDSRLTDQTNPKLPLRFCRRLAEFQIRVRATVRRSLAQAWLGRTALGRTGIR